MQNTVTLNLERYEELKRIEEGKDEFLNSVEKGSVLISRGFLSETKIYNPEDIHKKLISQLKESEEMVTKLEEEKDGFESQAETSTQAYLSENKKKNKVLRWFYYSLVFNALLLIILISINA